MLLIAVEMKDTLYEVLVEDGGMFSEEKVNQTELPKPLQLRVHQTAHKPEEQRPPPLEVVLL